ASSISCRSCFRKITAPGCKLGMDNAPDGLLAVAKWIHPRPKRVGAFQLIEVICSYGISIIVFEPRIDVGSTRTPYSVRTSLLPTPCTSMAISVSKRYRDHNPTGKAHLSRPFLSFIQPWYELCI